MHLLLDTHLVIWAVRAPERLGPTLRERLEDPSNTLLISTAVLWEIAIKHGRGRPDFVFDPVVVRLGLLAKGWVELPITGTQVIRVASLPPIHRDPFDRLLVAQAQIEGVTLLTADATLARYGAPVERVG